MRASAFVGRVGGLAVALGIGVAITLGGPAADAAPGDSTSASDQDSTAAATDSRPSVRSRTGRSAAAATASASPRSGDRGLTTPVAQPNTSSPGTKLAMPATLPLTSSTASFNLPVMSAATNLTAESVSDAVLPVAVAPEAEPEKAAVASRASALAAAPQGGLGPAPSPLSGHSPMAPAQSAVSWGVLAAARRERFDSRSAHVMPIALVRNSELGDTASTTDSADVRGTGVQAAAALVASTVSVQTLGPFAAATTTDPITAFFGQIQAFITQIVQAVTQAFTAIINVFAPVRVSVNEAPIPKTYLVATPDPATGVVTGQINAFDPNGDTLTYSGSTTTAKGVVEVNGSSGEFIYTPTAIARINAARDGANASDKADTFNITASDGRGASVTVGVTVAVSPQAGPGTQPTNQAPVAGTPVVGIPNTITGVVTGSVRATDANGDTLTYTAPASTTKGSVSIDASTGAFTYTPTVIARLNATASTTDAFTVTVTDGFGGSVAVPVTVPVTPTVVPGNQAPVVGTPTVGIPNITTGVVSGTVTATDGDNDALTYSAPSLTSKGTVSISSSAGTFTFTPTALARHSAAAPNATAADKADTFTITVTDGRGGIALVPVTVAIRPQNSGPTGIASVGILNPSTGSISGTVSGSDADGDALTYSGTLSTVQGNVTVDPKTGNFTYTPVARMDTVTAVITGFKTPADIAFNSDGSRAYISELNADRVSVFDTKTQTVVANISGVNNPISSAVTSGGSRLYVVNAADDSLSGLAPAPGSVSVVDTATNKVIGAISGLFSWPGKTPTPADIAVSPDGSVAYILDQTGGVSVVDTATDKVAATIALIRVPVSYTASYNLAFSPDGKRVYVTGLSPVVIDTITNTVSSVFAGVFDFTISPDGKRLYFNQYPGVVVTDSNLNRIAEVSTLGGSGYGEVAVSRDGKVLYTPGGTGILQMMDTSTNTLFAGAVSQQCGNCSTNVGYTGAFASPRGDAIYVTGVIRPNVLDGFVGIVTHWAGQRTDTFNVTIADGYGGTTVVPVTVSFVG